MKRLLVRLGVVACLAAGRGSAVAAEWPPLIGPGAMTRLYTTPNLRIVDLRPAEAYAEGHVDGAVSVPMGLWKEARTEQRLDALIGEAGIAAGRPIVLLGDDTAPARLPDLAWLYWELTVRGIEDVALVEGGHDAWAAAGQRLTTRVHRHRTYAASAPPPLPAIDAAGLEEVRLGLAEGALVEVTTGDAGAPPLPGVARVALDDLLRDPRDLADPALVLERVKDSGVPFGTAPILVFAERPEVAAAFWYLAHEVLGIEDVRLAPAAPDAEGVAQLSDR